MQHFRARSDKAAGLESILSPFMKTAERAFKDQVSAGVEVPSTGQTPDDFQNLYMDPRKVQGVKADGAGRKVTGDLKRKAPIRLDEVKYVYDLIDSVEVDGKSRRLFQLKEPITDPYTLATGVQNETNKDTRELTFEILREVVIPEARSMAPYVDCFQFDAPRYSNVSVRPDYLAKVYEEIRSELDKPVVLHVCGDTSRIFEELVKYDVDVLSLDFTLTPRLIEAAAKKNFDQKLGVGVAKTEPRVESVKEIRTLIETVRKEVGEDRLSFIHPACGQRNIPLGAAYGKNVNIALARDEVFYGDSGAEVATHSEGMNSAGLDPRGRFRILVDRDSGRIVVDFVDYNHRLKRRIVGDYADKIIHRMLSEDVLSEDRQGMRHLGYVARELGKAEAALHNDLDYRQDQPLLLQRG